MDNGFVALFCVVSAAMFGGILFGLGGAIIGMTIALICLFEAGF